MLLKRRVEVERRQNFAGDARLSPLRRHVTRITGFTALSISCSLGDMYACAWGSRHAVMSQ
jgi:hypothetical protein